MPSMDEFMMFLYVTGQLDDDEDDDDEDDDDFED